MRRSSASLGAPAPLCSAERRYAGACSPRNRRERWAHFFRIILLLCTHLGYSQAFLYFLFAEIEIGARELLELLAEELARAARAVQRSTRLEEPC